MSTKSKLRRKARRWMQDVTAKHAEEIKVEVSTARSAGYQEGSRAMERDITQLHARVFERYTDEGRTECTRAVVRFPDGDNTRPHRIKVAMPFHVSPRFGMGYVPKSVAFVEFMPILCSVTQQFDDQRCSLDWIQWAPNIQGDGSNELDGLKYTRTMTQARGKIAHAARMLRQVVEMSRHGFYSAEDASQRMIPDVMRAGQLVDDAAEELRLELGKFAPDGDSPQWLRGMDPWPPLRNPYG